MARDWVNIVQSLVAQAEDPSVTEAERKTFLDKALQIAQARGIEDALHESKQQVREEVTDAIRPSFFNPYTGAKQALYSAIATFFRCQVILLGKTQHHVFGYKSDIEKFEELYTILLLHGTNVLEHTRIPANVNTKAFKHSWWLGYASEISSRLKAATSAATVVSEPGTDIVLRNREQDVNKAVTKTYPRTTTVRRTYSSSSGFAAGRTEGARVGLNTQNLGNRGRNALN